MKCLFLSASAVGTGEWCRLRHMADSLRPFAEVDFAPALSFSLPFRLDHLISLPLYLLKVLLCDVDIIIGNKPYFNVTLPCIVARYFKKNKIVMDIDEPDFLYVSGWRARIIAAVQKPFPRFFDLVTYHNDLLRDFCINEFRVPVKKLLQVKQGVNVHLFSEQEFAVEPGSLFFMGSLDLSSNLEFILYAVKKVQERHRVSCTVAGGGILEPVFKALAARLKLRNIRFAGLLPFGQVVRKIASADVCLAYYDETDVNRYRSSMKIREYLAMGKKVACNDFGEILQFKEYTYQSSSGIDNFVDIICRALMMGDGRERKAPEYIRAHFNWDTIGKLLFDKLQKMVTEDL